MKLVVFLAGTALACGADADQTNRESTNSE